jgi:glycosyltransferase involved in cell wall biosynthesis
MMNKVVIIVPVYNEGKRCIETIKNILNETKLNMIVVDDGSEDQSLEMLINSFEFNKRVCVLSHVINLGKGAAMRTGAEYAFKLKYNSIIYIDADGQHNPKHLGSFEEALKGSDLVFGFRKMDESMPLVRRLGNVTAKWVINILFGIKRKDLLCGYMGFSKSTYGLILWESDRYGVETEIATRVGKKKLTFSEVEIDTVYIDKYKGVTILDAIKILFQIPIWYIKR